MFREITRQQGKAVPAAASHLCTGWVAALVAQSGWAEGRKASARQEFHMLEHHQNSNVWVFGCWNFDILAEVHCCPTPSVEDPNLSFPECTDGLKELTGQS